VHWNEDLYDSYEEATRREDGIVILAVFVTVSCLLRTVVYKNYYFCYGRPCHYVLLRADIYILFFRRLTVKNLGAKKIECPKNQTFSETSENFLT